MIIDHKYRKIGERYLNELLLKKIPSKTISLFVTFGKEGKYIQKIGHLDFSG